MTQHDDEAAARLLRETLRERADLLDGAPLTVPAVPPRRRSVGPLVGVAAAAVATVLAVAGVSAWRAPGPGTPAATGVTSPSASASRLPSRVPQGFKPVASLGVEILVPSSWRVTGTVNFCTVRELGTHVVSRPIGAVRDIGCAAERFADVTLVEFRPATQDLVAGRTKLPDGGERLTWITPDRSAAVVASGPDGDQLQDVVSTARAVDIDTLGCPTKPVRPGWDRRREGLPPVRLGSDVTEVVACIYTGVGDGGTYRMVAGARFDEAQRSALARALFRAPAGAAPDLPPETCLRGRPEDAFGVIRVRTSAGLTELTFHWDGCVDRYVAGPDSQSAITQALLATMMKSVNISYSFNGPLAAG